jgi:glycosyltransferase involved in cell wall biosynthesis
MKILFVTEFFPSDSDLRFTGGVEARTYHTAKLLAATDRAMVICRRTRELKQKLSMGNLTIYPCGPTYATIEASFLSIGERMAFIAAATWQGLRLNFDLIEGSNFITYLPAYMVGLIKHKPKVAWFADVLANDWIKFFGIAGLFGRILENISLHLNWDRVIALSRKTANKLIQNGISGKKISIIYGGVDFNEFQPMAGPPRAEKIEKSKAKNIICICRLVNYKKVDNLILAFNQLKDRFTNLKLTIIGQGPEEKKLKQLVAKLNLTRKAMFYANLRRDALIKKLGQSTIFCLPSIIEGFGLVTIESAACLTPYVISDIPINREITHNGLGGIFFKPEDVNDLTNKLSTLLTNKKLYEQKQIEAAKLGQFYKWPKIITQTRNVYRGVLDG